MCYLYKRGDISGNTLVTGFYSLIDVRNTYKILENWSIIYKSFKDIMKKMIKILKNTIFLSLK